MPDPRIATSYGNRAQTPMREYYPQIMQWVQSGAPATWGEGLDQKLPPNMYDMGIVPSSPEEDMILKLLYAALGTKEQQDLFEHKRPKKPTKPGGGKSSVDAADNIINS